MMGMAPKSMSRGEQTGYSLTLALPVPGGPEQVEPKLADRPSASSYQRPRGRPSCVRNSEPGNTVVGKEPIPDSFALHHRAQRPCGGVRWSRRWSMEGEMAREPAWNRSIQLPGKAERCLAVSSPET